MKLGKYLKAQSKIFYAKQNVAFNSKLIVSAGKNNANNSDFIFQSEFLYIFLTNPAKHRHTHENIQILTPMSPGWLPTLIWTMSWCRHVFSQIPGTTQNRKMALNHSKISRRRFWWGLNQAKVSCRGKEVSCWLPPWLCCPHSSSPLLPLASASLCGESEQQMRQQRTNSPENSELFAASWAPSISSSQGKRALGSHGLGSRRKKMILGICVMFLPQLSLELSCL